MSWEEMLHYLSLGGPTLWVLLLGSVLAMVVAFERLLALWGFTEQARELGQAVMRHLGRRDLPAARSAVERSPSVAGDVYLAGLDRAQPGSDGDRAMRAVDRERTQVMLKLKRNMWVLGTIGATAPFVGLFGTVAGIMKSFRDLGADVAQGGAGGTAAVMTGISEALVVTAVGILVAVEAVVLYNYFQSRLAKINVELRLVAEEFLETLRDPPIAAVTASPPLIAAPEGA